MLWFVIHYTCRKAKKYMSNIIVCMNIQLQLLSKYNNSFVDITNISM